ncbi:hypothetical protein EJ08DRAFT_127048 [Tothia fuscella]|uniref:Uncharacterized protein n=1 Tax=Tothia fuscella TaxID=1048955 RepID=A0A9P4NVX2_9PEZI|nr:hypothetical protein EJ08DRAFT_127048 [Tothia fuscella]
MQDVSNSRATSDGGMGVVSDPIEDTQGPVISHRRRSKTMSHGRRTGKGGARLNVLRPNIKKEAPQLDLTLFRSIKRNPQLRVTPVSLKNSVCEGFDKSDLKMAPKRKGKRVQNKGDRLPHQGLVLVPAQDANQLSPSFRQSIISYDVPHRAERKHVVSRSSNQAQQDKRLEELAVRADPEPIDIPDMHQSPTYKATRRVSFSTEVRSQLYSLTAPARASESDSEDDTAVDQSTESVSEAEEITSRPRSRHQTPTSHQQNADDLIEDAELVADADQAVEPPQLIMEEDSIEDDLSDHADTHTIRYQSLYFPGQARRMRSSGPWNQANDDIVDVDSPRPSTVTRGVPSSIVVKSILKRIVSSLSFYHFSGAKQIRSCFASPKMGGA